MEEQTARLIEAIENQTRLLREVHDYEKSWKNRLLTGLYVGLGSTVGVSIVLAIAGYVLKPWADNVYVKPIIERSESDRRR